MEHQGKENAYLVSELECVHILVEELSKAEGEEEGKELLFK